jgi:hypothetical protein
MRELSWAGDLISTVLDMFVGGYEKMSAGRCMLERRDFRSSLGDASGAGQLSGGMAAATSTCTGNNTRRSFRNRLELDVANSKPPS